MRYLPPQSHSSDPNGHFVNYQRPPDDDLPLDVVALMDERDRLAGLHAEQYAECVRLADPILDNQARIDDDRLAGEALRAGKVMPAPTAVPALAEQRAEAGRALAAYADAIAQIRFETNELTAAISADNHELLKEANQQALTDATRLLYELLDVIEGNIRFRAVDQWYRGHSFHRTPQVAITDILNPAATAIGIRDLLTATVATVLEDPNA